MGEGFLCVLCATEGGLAGAARAGEVVAAEGTEDGECAWVDSAVGGCTRQSVVLCRLSDSGGHDGVGRRRWWWWEVHATVGGLMHVAAGKTAVGPN